MVQILAVQVVRPGTHDMHVAAVRWYNPESGEIAVATTSVMVDFIKKGGKVYFFDGRNRHEVIASIGVTPFLSVPPALPGTVQTTLLSLPRF